MTVNNGGRLCTGHVLVHGMDFNFDVACGTNKILSVQTLDANYATPEGIKIGATLRDAVKSGGHVVAPGVCGVMLPSGWIARPEMGKDTRGSTRTPCDELLDERIAYFDTEFAGFPPESPERAPVVDERWEEAAIPICSADTEGAVIGSSLVGSAKPKFVGRVVRLGPDGKRIPVPGVRIFRYMHNFWIPGAVADWDPKKSYLAPEDFTTDVDGAFRDSSSNTTPAVNLVECRSGKPTERLIPEAVVFLLRASGCEDRRVVFDTGWIPHDIEMTCRP